MNIILKEGLKEIPRNVKYTGYIWMSDMTSPKILNNEFLNGNYNTINPFIIEGMLYCIETKISYYLVFDNGKTKVFKYDLNTIPASWQSDKNDEYEYVSSFSDTIGLKFLKYWKPEKDPLCENMEVLVPVMYIFYGFNSK